jgi:hypothetical protein
VEIEKLEVVLCSFREVKSEPKAEVWKAATLTLTHRGGHSSSQRVHEILIEYDPKGLARVYSEVMETPDTYRKSKEVGQHEGKAKHGRLAGVT